VAAVVLGSGAAVVLGSGAAVVLGSAAAEVLVSPPPSLVQAARTRTKTASMPMVLDRFMFLLRRAFRPFLGSFVGLDSS
jgi:hypothetical protein